MHPLRLIIRRFDHWLSRREGVEPFTADPQVILRLQRGSAAWNIPLPQEVIPIHSRILVLHLWNERIPAIPANGPDLVWARHFQIPLIYSFKAMADFMQAAPDLQSIRAVGGYMAHINLYGPDGGRLMLERLGFTIYPYHRPAGAFGEFWENFYTWWLMWTYNPSSVRRRTWLSLQRIEFWMTMDGFLRRFGN